MNIQRVVRDLVTTKRHFWLEALSLRVVEDHKSTREVAVDAVSARPGDFVFTIGVSAARIAAGDPRIVTDLTIGGIIDRWDEGDWRAPPAARPADAATLTGGKHGASSVQPPTMAPSKEQRNG